MIESVGVTNFKCFKKAEIKLNNLTLLTGSNSSGKSTVIQAILLAAHNISNNSQSPLNGPTVSIGNFNEAKNFMLNEKKIIIKIKADGEQMVLEFQKNEDSFPVCREVYHSKYISNLLNNSNEKIHHIPAEREGVLDLYLKNYSASRDPGVRADFVIDFFERNKKMRLEDEKIVDQGSFTLDAQCNYWLKKILGCEIETEDIVGTDNIKVMYSQNRNRSVRPRNTGGGVSYLVVVLVICLAAKRDDVVLIENPEIHLHPLAQSLLTDFFIFISKTGVQLVVETHSDHIFNGVRKNIHQKKIDSKSASVLFFNLDKDGGCSEHVDIKIDENGKVANHQKGLFDQFNSDLNDLLGL